MALNERSAPHALEGRQGPSVTDKTNSTNPTKPHRVRLIVDSMGGYRPVGRNRNDEFAAIRPAIVAAIAADQEYGRPLDYDDPVGERATWNALLTATNGARRRR